MIAKCCAAPKGGGSARGAVRYILGYAVGEKRGQAEVKNQAFTSLMNEARERDDYGIGAVWSPKNGDGKRPAAIYSQGFASLATADLEMEAWHSANGQTVEAAAHEVFSFSEADGNVSNERIVAAVLCAYEIAGFGDAPKIVTIHRDTDHVHAHVARSRIDPRTLRAYDHAMLKTRLDRGCRSAELQDGNLTHDRGLVVVREMVDGTKYIDHSTYYERKAWKYEHQVQRIADLERRRFSEVSEREGSFERYADANVEPRIRSVLQRAEDHSESPLVIDILNAAFQRGTQVEIIDDKDGARAYLRNVSTHAFRERQAEELRSYEASISHVNGEKRDVALKAFHGQQADALRAELERVQNEGALAPLSDDLQQQLGDLDQYRDVQSAEEAYARIIEADPGRIARDLTTSEATFSRNDIERHIARRVTDAGEIERLAEHVVNTDRSLVLLSPDVESGIYTTKEMLEIESELAGLSRDLAAEGDAMFSADALERAISEMELERTQALVASGLLDEGEMFVLSSEQRQVLAHLDKRLSLCRGVAGAGKTTIMEVVRRYGDATQRPVVGLTLSQSAAERLETETGIKTYNSTLALLLEDRGREIIPRGAIVVVDEASMIDSRTMLRVNRLVQSRDAQIKNIGDNTQLSAIGAGNAFHIVTRAAQAAASYSELNETRRQRLEWHRDAVYAMTDGIENRKSSRVDAAVDLWNDNGALLFCESYDQAITDAVSWYEQQAKGRPDVLILASDNDSVRFLNEEIRRKRNLDASGWTYRTEDGARELCDGDRFIFGKNNRRLGVSNGDTGTVVAHDRYSINVELDRNGREVKIDSRKYRTWDHGYATTIHLAQGASVSSIGAIIDRSATAQLAHVAASRSREAMALFVSEQAFESHRDLANHLAERSTAKTTTQDFSAQLATRGGPDTYVARNSLQVLVASESRLVVAYERAQAEKRAKFEIAIADLRDKYRELRATSEPTLYGTLRSEQYSQEQKLVKDYAPDKKGEWLSSRRALEREHQNGVAQTHSTQQGKEPLMSLPTYLEDELKRSNMTYGEFLASQWKNPNEERGHYIYSDSEGFTTPDRHTRTLRVEELTMARDAARGRAMSTATVFRDERGQVAFIDRAAALSATTTELRGVEQRGPIQRPFEIDVPNPTRENIAAALEHYKSRYGVENAATLRFVGSDRSTSIWVDEAKKRGFNVDHQLTHDQRLSSYAKANDRSIREPAENEKVEGRVARIQSREDGKSTVLVAVNDNSSEYVRVDLPSEHAQNIEIGDNVRVQGEELERVVEIQQQHDMELVRERAP